MQNLLVIIITMVSLIYTGYVSTINILHIQLNEICSVTKCNFP